MNQSFEISDGSFVSYDKAAEVLQPGIGAFYYPAMAISPELTPVLMSGFTVIPPRGYDGFDVSVDQHLARFVAVISFVSNQPFRLASELSLVKLFQSHFQQGYFRRGRRVHVNSERSTRAIGQYHELCSLAALGFADRCALFLPPRKCRQQSIRSSEPSLAHPTRLEMHARG